MVIVSTGGFLWKQYLAHRSAQQKTTQWRWKQQITEQNNGRQHVTHMINGKLYSLWLNESVKILMVNREWGNTLCISDNLCDTWTFSFVICNFFKSNSLPHSSLFLITDESTPHDLSPAAIFSANLVEILCFLSNKAENTGVAQDEKYMRSTTEFHPEDTMFAFFPIITVIFPEA